MDGPSDKCSGQQLPTGQRGTRSERSRVLRSDELRRTLNSKTSEERPQMKNATKSSALPWSSDDIVELIHYKESGRTWKQLGVMFPERTIEDLQIQYRLLNPKSTRQPHKRTPRKDFTTEEDTAILSLSSQGLILSEIADRLGTNRAGATIWHRIRRLRKRAEASTPQHEAQDQSAKNDTLRSPDSPDKDMSDDVQADAEEAFGKGTKNETSEEVSCDGGEDSILDLNSAGPSATPLQPNPPNESTHRAIRESPSGPALNPPIHHQEQSRHPQQPTTVYKPKPSPIEQQAPYKTPLEYKKEKILRDWDVFDAKSTSPMQPPSPFQSSQNTHQAPQLAEADVSSAASASIMTEDAHATTAVTSSWSQHSASEGMDVNRETQAGECTRTKRPRAGYNPYAFDKGFGSSAARRRRLL